MRHMLEHLDISLGAQSGTSNPVTLDDEEFMGSRRTWYLCLLWAPTLMFKKRIIKPKFTLFWLLNKKKSHKPIFDRWFCLALQNDSSVGLQARRGDIVSFLPGVTATGVFDTLGVEDLL